MKIITTDSSNISDILKIDFDLFLASSGYEERAIFMYQEINLNAKRKIVFGFKDHLNIGSRKKNDIFFSRNGFELIETSGDEENKISLILTSLLDFKKPELNILVDYSCMTRIWYASLLKFIQQNTFASAQINIFFSYSFSEFIEPPKEKVYNRHVGPIEGFYNISIPDKPTAIIIGLGYVKERAFGLAEYFDVDPYLFIADNNVSQDYFDNVHLNNEDLLEQVNKENIFYYPLDNLKYTETILSHLCEELKETNRIVLAPCGPKPFTLVCLITSLRKNYIDVWRISAGEGDYPLDLKASGEIMIYKVSFVL